MYVIATDPGTITTIQRVGFAFWEPGLFQNGCLTKHGAKWAEVVQKFVPRSRVGIFRNEHTRSTPLDPKLMFWCVTNHLGAIRTVWLPFESRWKTSQPSAKVRATKSLRFFFG